MSGDTPRRERKVVTVVFCDLVGFTARAESMDPEDVEALLAPVPRARSRRARAPWRHGREVHRRRGHGALRRADRARGRSRTRRPRGARDPRLRDRRTGSSCASGSRPARRSSRSTPRPAEGEGMASGDVVNTAARLQSAAPVNGVLVDETTYRATRQAIDYDEATAVEAKGKTAPVSVWERTGRASRFGVDVAHEARTDLVGTRARARRGCARHSVGRDTSGRHSSSLSSAFPGSGRAASSTSSRGSSRPTPSSSPGDRGAASPTATVSRSGRSARSSRRRPASSKQDTPSEVAEKLPKPLVRLFRAPTTPPGSKSHLLALVGVAGEASSAEIAEPRPSLRGAAFFEGARRSAPARRSSSRTCTGPTRACSTSSTSWSTG